MARPSRASAKAPPTKGTVTKDQLAKSTDEMNKILFAIHDDAIKILPPNEGTDEEARVQATLPAKDQVAEGKKSEIVLEPESPEQWHALIPYMPIPFLEELISDAAGECENFMNM
ncbi:hypothetical protein KEM56_000046 [Ascosphaera pollenicola]|nr:hypothetical protein KEM56_000046 [Ascosphaera pollenicola]